MAKIIAPNKEYAGISAGISFTAGEAHTDDPYLIDWFRSHGYEVSEEKKSGKGKKAKDPDATAGDQKPDDGDQKPAETGTGGSGEE